MSAKPKDRPKHRGRKSLARGKLVMFAGRFTRSSFAGIKTAAKERGVSTAEALRQIVDKGLGLPVRAAAPQLSSSAKGARGPVLIVTGPASISLKRQPVAVRMPADGLEPGADYGIRLKGKTPVAEKLTAVPGKDYLGGFHFAPGGNATADRGGDDKPAINPFSVWDCSFRPACPDPRGMTLVDVAGKKVWVDIYLLAADHLANGTSRFGVKIADGDDPPQNPKGGRFPKLDYATAAAIVAHHGKGLLSPDEFYAAAAGVTERSSAKGDPGVTGLDAARTSKFGLMQASGNLWAWVHDETLEKRASVCGGSWLSGGYAGSCFAVVACRWLDISYDSIGARGRSDHLQPE